MVKTKSLFDKSELSDGKRIVVSYKLPSKYYLSTHNAVWEVYLPPYQHMVYGYRAGQITWEKYTELYLLKMKLPRAAQAIKKLATLSLIQDITLLCYEKEDNPHCHRHLLKALIDQVASELS